MRAMAAQRFDLAGKVALVTGAAQGIGFETARGLHGRGATVGLLDLDLQAATDAANAIGDRTVPFAGDVTDQAAVETAVAELVGRFGGVDLVVANAGIAPPMRTVLTIGSEEFERVVDVDLFGVWRTVRAALPQIVERRGHVVVVASVYAFMNGVLASPYAVAKAGVEQFGKALRAELQPHGASASVAYFGFIDTPMVQDAFEDPIAQRLEEAFPKFMLKRMTPQQAGAAVVAGIERRQAQIILPRWWRAVSMLRGLVGPLLDRRLERDRRVAEAVREAEAEASAGTRADG
jgi:NAD(P)-dependent dehydrogenase (short-subunit alcohol dehydrogenase family)